MHQFEINRCFVVRFGLGFVLFLSLLYKTRRNGPTRDVPRKTSDCSVSRISAAALLQQKCSDGAMDCVVCMQHAKK